MFPIEKHRNSTIAISDKGEDYSYENALEFTNQFKEIIPSRSLVLCLTENNIESLFGYLALILTKAVPVLVDHTTHAHDLVTIISNYRPNYIWLNTKNIDEFKTFEIIFSFKNYSLIKSLEIRPEKINENLALLLSTSGSTGSPKFVRLSYTNLIENSKSIIAYLGINKKERPVTSLPFHYSYGLSIINSHLFCGATILLTNQSVIQRGFWDFIKSQKASSLSGVPYTYDILKKLRMLKMDLPHLLTLTQAGGKLNSKLAEEFAKYCYENGKRFFMMYGQTEATARMSYLPSTLCLEKPKSIGKAIPGGEFKLIGDNGGEVGVNESGELVYHGANVSMGYAHSIEDLTKEDENRGVLYTGDIAEKDEEGLYYIIGRKKRFIKIFGNRISLDETESLIKAIVEDCACSGQDDKMEIFFTGDITNKEIVDFISKRTNIHHSAFIVYQLPQIPRNSFGKVQYSKLLKND
ncbi:MAG: long-chain acyl-CoA synthetase [Luteibaculaceae bacterium]|jgi:long-chain acyl-CoA synthetase